MAVGVCLIVYYSGLAGIHNTDILQPLQISCPMLLAGGGRMAEPLMIDLKALLVEREDCDAGTVQKVSSALAQAGSQYRSLREVTEILQKRAEQSTGPVAKRWHLKLGIASFFLGNLEVAIENLKQAEGALAYFFL